MSSPELDALIVEHLVDLDRAAKRIADIESRLISSMNTRAQEWAERNGWIGDFKFRQGDTWDDWYVWLAPKDWLTTDDPDDIDVWFDLEFGAGATDQGAPSEAWHHLTRFLGLENGQIGLRFHASTKLNKRGWRSIVDQFSPRVEQTRFIVDTEATFFLPVRIDAKVLAEALRNDDPDAALGPFTDALSSLMAAKPVFDEIVKYIRGS
jgi:hypothetical protein